MNMLKNQQITIQPIVSYPRKVEIGKTYLLTVDLQTILKDNDWPYKEEEEYAIYCLFESNSFNYESIGEPVIILNRFGGSYGPASFLIKVTSEEVAASIDIKFINNQGLYFTSIKLKDIQIVKEIIIRKKLIRIVRIFISAPGDVQDECQRIHKEVARINRMWGDVYDVKLEVIDWKTYVPARMDRPTQEMINSQINDSDIFIGVLWKRFGTPTGKAASGTEEEFNIAFDNWEKYKRPRILFYFRKTPLMPKASEEVVQLSKVITFKAMLQTKALICDYQSSEELADLVQEHLLKVLQEWFKPKKQVSPVADFTRYLRYLRNETMYIDIRGISVGTGKAHRFYTDQIYIPLKTSSAEFDKSIPRNSKIQKMTEIVPHELELKEALKQTRLIIKGDPGSGKTTFLRWVAFTLCQNWLGEDDKTAQQIFASDPLPLPIFVRLGRLSEYMRQYNETDAVPYDSLENLLRFLDEQSRVLNWKLTAEDFRHELGSGQCLILLDGLDEVYDRTKHEKILSLVNNILRVYPDCRIMLTSRPAALFGEAIPSGFSIIETAPFDDAAIQNFISLWSTALFSEAQEKAQYYQQELILAIKSRPEILRMARTPVMLTALAAVHWNEKRLPEQRSDLFESIITWLLRSRERRPGRLPTDYCRKLLQKLALGMFIDPEGRQRQVGIRWAAELLSSEFEKDQEQRSIEKAEYFLYDEQIDSGIIIQRGNKLEFWHLSFQEYLAASEIAGMLEQEQIRLLFQNDRFYNNEWRELVLLLSGILYTQGEQKINHLIDAILQKSYHNESKESLPQLAMDVAIVSNILRELSPFQFRPSNPKYNEIVKNVLAIFDRNIYRKIPMQIRIETADALGRAGDPRIQVNNLIHIPVGSFLMGSQKSDIKRPNYDPDANEDESPLHEIKLSLFKIGRYLITVEQYNRFINDGGFDTELYWKNGGFDTFKAPLKWDEQLSYPTRPVVGVSWYEATAYARWAGGALPTEAQWERAAKGPSQEFHKYPWGDMAPDGEIANSKYAKFGYPSPVGVFPADCSPEGILDMGGNVSEWCQDWYSEEYYKESNKQKVVENPLGPESGKYCVVRGGSFESGSAEMRCSYRRGVNPNERSLSIGFRLVMSADSDLQISQKDEIYNLIKAIEENDGESPVIKHKLMERLAKLNQQLAKEKLSEWIKNPIALEEWESAVQILRDLDIESARSALAKALENAESGLRWQAVTRLAEIANAEIWKIIQHSFLEEPDVELKNHILQILSEDNLNKSFIIDHLTNQFIKNIDVSENQLAQVDETIDKLHKNLSNINELKSIYDKLILYGSLARGTAISPIADIDIFAVFNFDPNQVNPRNAFETLKKALEKIYRSNILTDSKKVARFRSFGASILIEFYDAIRLEITPAYEAEQTKILIPDTRLQRWLPSNHEKHTAYTNELNNRTSGRYKDLLKIIKYWQYHPHKKRFFHSFVLECLIAENFIFEVLPILDLFEMILKRIQKSYSLFEKIRYVPELGVPGKTKSTGMTSTRYKEFMDLILKTLLIIQDAKKADNIKSEIDCWIKIFGSKFPLKENESF